MVVAVETLARSQSRAGARIGNRRGRMSTQERPADGIRINVPDESSMVTVASGEAFVVEIEDGRRVVYLRHDDARRLLNGGLPCCFPWREANATLAETLGPPPKPTVGIHASVLAAARNAAPRADHRVYRHVRSILLSSRHQQLTSAMGRLCSLPK